MDNTLDLESKTLGLILVNTHWCNTQFPLMK